METSLIRDYYQTPSTGRTMPWLDSVFDSSLRAFTNIGLLTFNNKVLHSETGLILYMRKLSIGKFTLFA